MIQLHVAITHFPTPEREAWLAEHLRLLGGGLPVTVCTDWIGGRRLANYRMAWAAAHGTRATHLVVLSDDMRPCPMFHAHLLGALKRRPTAIVCLFTMRRCLAEARDAGLSWIDTPNCAWGGAMVMPVEHWQAMAEWEREHVIDDLDHQSDDTRIALWVAATGRRIFLTAPSLVQHVGAGSSVIGHSNRNRVSPWVADETRVDWDTASLRASRCARGDPAWLR